MKEKNKEILNNYKQEPCYFCGKFIMSLPIKTECKDLRSIRQKKRYMTRRQLKALFSVAFILLLSGIASAQLTDTYYPNNRTDIFKYNGNTVFTFQTTYEYQNIDRFEENNIICSIASFPVSDNFVWHWTKYNGTYNLSSVVVTGVPPSYTVGQCYNINVTATKIPEANSTSINIYPSFLGFNLYNHTWFNATWEKRITYNMTNIEYRKIVNMSNGDGIIPYNKSDRWFNHSDNLPLHIFNYTLINGQTFVHIQGNLNGNTQWDKYVNNTNFYPGVENATQTYNFWDNISVTQQFNVTKWDFNNPALMSQSIVGDALQINCLAGCAAGVTTVMRGGENLTQFSNEIFIFNPVSTLGIGGQGFRNGDYSSTSIDKSSAWIRNDDVFFTGTPSTSSSDAVTINTAQQKIEINRTPWYNKLYVNDSLKDNKTTNIYNGQMIALFTPLTAGSSELFYSIIAYNRSANATFTQFQTLTYPSTNFTSWSNNATNNTDLIINVINGSVVRFNASSSVNCDNCSWYVNGVPYPNATALNQTSINYSFIAVGNYYINLTVINNTFSSIFYLNWTVTSYIPAPPPTVVKLDGFVNNSNGAPVDGVKVNLSNSTAHFIAYTHTQFFVNNTDLAPVFGTGDIVAGTTYYANDTSIQVYLLTHNPTATDIDIDIDIDGVRVQDDDVHITAINNNRSKWWEVPQGSNWSFGDTGSHHYEVRIYPEVRGYYYFKNIPTGNYNISFQQVGYNNLTSNLSLTSNMRFNATISPAVDNDDDIFSMAVLGFILAILAICLVKKCYKRMK